MPSVQYRPQVMVTSVWWLECAKSRELSVLLINAHPGYLTNGIHPMSHGKAVVAMIINGPWFYGQSLHRFPRFFANNPLERLIKDGIAFEHINNNIKVMVLDGFFDPEVSKVYFKRAIKVKRHLEEASPCTILAEPFFKMCWKANHFILLYQFLRRCCWLSAV